MAPTAQAPARPSAAKKAAAKKSPAPKAMKPAPAATAALTITSKNYPSAGPLLRPAL